MFWSISVDSPFPSGRFIVINRDCTSFPGVVLQLHQHTNPKHPTRALTIYIWKILESIVPNLSQPITCYFSDRRGRLCHLEHVCAGRLGTLSYNSFR